MPPESSLHTTALTVAAASTCAVCIGVGGIGSPAMALPLVLVPTVALAGGSKGAGVVVLTSSLAMLGAGASGHLSNSPTWLLGLALIVALAALMMLTLLDSHRRQLAIGEISQMLEAQEASSAAIREQQALTEALLDAVPTGLLALGNDLSIQHVNVPIREMLNANDPVAAERFRELLDDLTSHDGDIDLAVGDRVIAVRGASTPIGWLMTCTDVTERTTLERAATAAMQAAQRADSAQSSFLGAMNHEVRTPLTAVMGYTEMLLDEASERDQADLGRIQAAGKHLLALVDDILDMSRIIDGDPQVTLESVDLVALCIEAAETIRPTAEARGNRLKLELPEPPNVHTDGKKVRQILLNLLSNAAKFTHDGSITLTLETTPTRLRVTDSGKGIAPEDVESLFTPFHQLDRSHDAGGTGLGLSLSKRFAELLGGTIEVESEVGRGSTFTLVLP